MRQMEAIRGSLRLAMSEGVIPRDTNVDRVTATALAMGVLRKFHEGYFGSKLSENIDKAGELRRSNPSDYDRQLVEHAQYIADLKGIAPDMRLVEALTSTDLALGLALTRADASRQRDNRPAFKTDLLDPAFTSRRTVDNLSPIESRNGVKLADTFLRRRAEASNVAYTSFEATDGFYTVEGYELALNYTNEMKRKDKYGQLQDAAREMGQAAARTRALIVLDAILRLAPRLVLPGAAAGPNIDNLRAVVALMGDQVVDGEYLSATMTDVFTSGAWNIVAKTALTTPTLALNTSGGVTLEQNPVYNAAEIHNEQILTLAPWGDYPGLDRKTWFALDRDATPLEFATLRGFEAGPQTLVEVPHTVDLDLGSFDNQLFRTKVVDYGGADVANKAGVLVVPGTSNAPDVYRAP